MPVMFFNCYFLLRFFFSGTFSFVKFLVYWYLVISLNAWLSFIEHHIEYHFASNSFVSILYPLLIHCRCFLFQLVLSNSIPAPLFRSFIHRLFRPPILPRLLPRALLLPRVNLRQTSARGRHNSIKSSKWLRTLKLDLPLQPKPPVFPHPLK